MKHLMMTEIITLKPLTNEALADLFLAMSIKDEAPKDAEIAFCEFHSRYKNYLYTILKKACSSWKMYGEDLIEAVFDNTFLKVYEKADTFIFIDDIADKGQDKRMKAWLGKVAHREMLQLLREYRDDNIDFIEDFSLYEESEESHISIESPELQLLEKALNSIKERDRDILKTYLMYEDGNKKLPRVEIQRLANCWGVHPDNLRQIKKRSLDKVKEYVNKFKVNKDGLYK